MNYPAALTIAISLALIGVGLYFIYPPLSPLGVGIILWADLTIGALTNGRGSQ